MTRAIVVLLVLTVALQLSILYRQNASSRADRPEPSVQDAPSGVTIDLKSLPTKGSPNADIALIELSDYECPFCARHATTVANQIQDEFISKGTLLYAFANNPLPIHANAELLAEAAICAEKQDLFWQMHDALFQSMPKTKAEVLVAAEKVGTDPQQFENCLSDSRELLEKIEGDQKYARTLGLTGTPGFAIGTLAQNGSVAIKKIIVGAQTLSVFKDAFSEVSSQ
jgi:protein-disulfide isomerase